jgi:methylmalonyl-CoA mutase N-terminal domain/subunit
MTTTRDSQSDNPAFGNLAGQLVPAADLERTVEQSQFGPPLIRMHGTSSGIPLAGSYGPEPADESTASPGQYPFTRGLTTNGYRDELWHRDIYAGFGNAEDAGQRFEALLRGGASGVNIALDLPTQLGFDSDHPDALAETGKVGVAIDTYQDVADLFANIPLRDAKIVFTVANGIGPMALAWFMMLGKDQGADFGDYVIHLQNDPLKEYAGRGAFIFPLEPSVRLACDVVEYVARNGYAHWKPIGICGSHFRWGGGTAIHEIGLGIAAARTYIDELLRRGLDIDDFAPLLEMHLVADLDLLEEVAKFRAARRLWARMLRDDYGAKRAESQHLRVSLYTGGYRLTAQEPLNNSVRITLQALGAILGGVQHLGTLSIDEALATPSAEAARLAVQTQNVLAYETSVASVADPLGGSYLIESLTDEIEVRCVELMSQIEAAGGFIAALRAGTVQAMIDEASYQYQLEVEAGDRTVAGVNRFVLPDPGPSSVKVFRIDDESVARQVERLQASRAARDERSVTASLDDLEAAAAGPANLMPPILLAFENGASIGEVCDRLRNVFGTWREERVSF